MPARPGDLTLVYRVRHTHDIVFRDELETLVQSRGARIHYLVGQRDEPVGDALDPASLERLVPDIRDRDVYLCGPLSMMDRVDASLRSLGLPRRQIHVERFSY